MINRIIVPLNGSALAKCGLPHISAIAPVTYARVALVQDGGGPAVDSVEQHW